MLPRAKYAKQTRIAERNLHGSLLLQFCTLLYDIGKTILTLFPANREERRTTASKDWSVYSFTEQFFWTPLSIKQVFYEH